MSSFHPQPVTPYEKQAISIAEVVKQSGFSRSFVYGEIKAKRLAVRHKGRRCYVLAGDFMMWLASDDAK